MIPGVLGTTLFLGVPLVVEGVAGSNRGSLGGAFGMDCSADSCSCMSTSESGKFIGEDIVPVVDNDRDDEDNEGTRPSHFCHAFVRLHVQSTTQGYNRRVSHTQRHYESAE